LTAFNREQARRKLIQTAIEANQRSVDLSKRLYDAGVIDFLNVLTAQQTLYQSQDQLAQSEQTVSTDLIALYKALGGGWETSDQAAAKAADAVLDADKHSR
jgi:outer membrane protein TolC